MSISECECALSQIYRILCRIYPLNFLYQNMESSLCSHDMWGHLQASLGRTVRSGVHSTSGSGEQRDLRLFTHHLGALRGSLETAFGHQNLPRNSHNDVAWLQQTLQKAPKCSDSTGCSKAKCGMLVFHDQRSHQISQNFFLTPWAEPPTSRSPLGAESVLRRAQSVGENGSRL